MIFFSEKQMKKVVKEIGVEVNKILPNYRFYKCDKRWWIRKWGWRTDGIRLSRTFSGVLFNFEIYIPPSKEDSEFGDELQNLAHKNLGYIAGLSTAEHEFPRFAWQYEEFKQWVINDFVKGMDWFSNFDTPQSCWDYMLKNEWDINSPASKYAKEYLDFLAEHPERLNCGYEHDYVFPNELTRALFDIDWKGPLPEMPEADSFISELNKD